MYKKATSLLVAIIATMSMTGCSLLEVNSGSLDSEYNSLRGKSSAYSSELSEKTDSSSNSESGFIPDKETLSDGKVTSEDKTNIGEQVKSEDTYMGNQRQRAVKMLSVLDKGTKNIMISPLSIETALGLSGNGLTETGRNSIEKYLGQSIEQINTDNKEYIQKKNSEEELKIANSVWIKESLAGEINKAFESEVRANYLADVNTFNSDAKPINSWVHKNTNGMIPEIIESIDPELKAVLINAIYFKGEWENQFNTSAVMNGKFKTPDEEVECEYMTGKVETYLENTQATGFIKEYNNGYSFVGILPKEKSIDLETFNIDTLLETKSKSCDVYIKLPKFESEYSTCLKDTLIEMGMKDIFEAGGMDNIFESGSITTELSDVIHKTAIKVNEEGTEASAVTAGLIRGVSVTPMKKVYLDRPFIYAIMDTETNSILFIGSMYNPSK